MSLNASDLKVGDQLDVEDADKSWSICTVIEVDKEKKQFKVHYEGWHKKYDQWIDFDAQQSEQKDNNDDDNGGHTKQQQHKQNLVQLNNLNTQKKYTALNTYTPISDHLKKPKKLQQTNHSNVVFYTAFTPQKKRFFVITSDAREEDKFVYKYDITNEHKMTWDPLVSYPEHFMPSSNGNILGNSDEDKHILYMIGGKHGVFAKLNLENGEWQMLCKNNTNDIEKHREFGLKAIWSPSMFWLNQNELHLFGNVTSSKREASYHSLVKNVTISHHLKYDKTTDKFTEISNSAQNGFQHLQNGKIVHLEHVKRLMCFSGDRDVYCCDDFEHFTWKKMDISLPVSSPQYLVIHVMQYLVFVLYFATPKSEKQMWMLDVLQWKWYQSHKCCPSMHLRAKAHIINTQDGWLHFVGGNKYHFKVDMDDMIPQELHSIYDQRSDLLVGGFIKSIEKEFVLFGNVNQDLRRLLQAYFPKFGL